MTKGYEDFRKGISGKFIEKTEWREQATFVPNKKLPIYSWFYYKEGFSKQLVENIIQMLGLKKGQTVLDAFCGVGTALLCCKENEINSIGFDVMPVSVFAAKVKTSDHDLRKIEENSLCLKTRFVKLNAKYPSYVKRAFSKYALQDIAFIRDKIVNEIDPEVREFFVLALISAAMKCSYAYKDGSVIKYKKRPTAPLRKMMQHVVKKMINDIEKTPKTAANVEVEINDSRYMPLEDSSIDGIITSPPYINNIDYTKVYSIEEFFVHGEPIPGVRVFVGLKDKESGFLDEINLPLQARLYFEDMNKVLEEMHRVLKPNGKVAIVVGNGYVDDVIESDIILSYLAEKIGFSVENIFVLNKRFALEDRTTKKGTLRESLIILKKI